MGILYFFDDYIKKYMMMKKKYCNPTNTGYIGHGLSCIRENDVNLYIYKKIMQLLHLMQDI